MTHYYVNNGLLTQGIISFTGPFGIGNNQNGASSAIDIKEGLWQFQKAQKYKKKSSMINVFFIDAVDAKSWWNAWWAWSRVVHPWNVLPMVKQQGKNWRLY